MKKSFDEQIGEYQENRDRREALYTMLAKAGLFVLGIVLGFLLGLTY